MLSTASVNPDKKRCNATPCDAKVDKDASEHTEKSDSYRHRISADIRNDSSVSLPIFLLFFVLLEWHTMHFFCLLDHVPEEMCKRRMLQSED